ncbi:MAG: excinuclease ABC subunit UvrA [Prolixibacteraceae bacterium]|nr:excinuclease ABC subunit UvrA [Prolixibacteraceae bacterium]MBN2648994.1 excinuclease ABC subunit UvrA [Prolixibacteraceae bacterium]
MSGKSIFNNYIHIKGARLHNLKNIELKIPRNQFVVITGVSGSGKSTLAFDTLYAEGQRRYVESLSSYARQFLGRINKPEVDFIKGIPPAIAIEQKVNTRNPRSTVGTSTEIYDYLKLLFSRAGKTISPVSGNEVKKQDVSDVVDYLLSFPVKTKALVLAPLKTYHSRKLEDELGILFQQGFTRLESKGQILKIDSAEAIEEIQKNQNTLNIVIDRISIDTDDDSKSRFADSVQAAFNEGHGLCIIKIYAEDQLIEKIFSHRFELDGILFDEPSLDMFSFNNPIGACPRCEGYGKVIGIDEDLVIPNKNLSVYDDAVACWKGEKMSEWKTELINHASKFDFPIHKPYRQLTPAQQKLLWTGNQYFHGLNDFFAYLESNSYKIQYRVMMARYRGKTTCPDCGGSRLKKEAGYVKISGKSIQELVLMPVYQLRQFFDQVQFDSHQQKITERLLREINNRLSYLCDVGLGYLTLNRLSSTLSGGESQRINLATSLGSGLVGSLYILDEPSIGLHSRDTQRLLKVLIKLRDLGNTVVVVEHDEEIIRAADQVLDIGPRAGVHGGEIMFYGTQHDLTLDEKSLTAAYLNQRALIPVPKIRRKWNNYIELFGARENNLQNIDVKIPLNIMTVVSGVSGSGKSSLVKQVLYPALAKRFGQYGEQTGKHDQLSGDIHLLHAIEFVDQNPIGKSSRSNPVTYIKAYDEIRALFSRQQAAKVLGLKPSHFSFNVDGGRCDECQGEGQIKVEMQFMADIYLTCESCGGKRFKEDILEVKYQGHSIYDILELSVDEAIDLFGKSNKNGEAKIAARLKPLQDVGLGYIKLGQASNTLSGGESQRVKLASFLAKEKEEHTLFIFDEPTTGLHFHDIDTLLKSLNALIDRGHTVLIVEHNLEIIKSADWVIDMGPEGGDKGGQVVFEGTPENLILSNNSHTGKSLKNKL